MFTRNDKVNVKRDNSNYRWNERSRYRDDQKLRSNKIVKLQIIGAETR